MLVSSFDVGQTGAHRGAPGITEAVDSYSRLASLLNARLRDRVT